MRTPSNAATNPWGNSIDDGWRDLVVSSAPPPPPREALDTGPKNRALPSDITTWQEHGAARVAVEPAEEPSFTAADRRLWVIAGTLMALAALVLGVLGVLTFGGVPSTSEPAAEPAHAAAMAPGNAEPARATAPAQAASAMASAVKPSPNGPRALKRTKHARHHKRIAER